ncbi:MAG: NmrA family NAD(P)-binding protein [Acidobacteriaceae bacterium]|nr:NmrA family NAD(P)-binding protein [Acidobacteriaceae bacterium]
MSQTVLLAGATGMLGSQIARHLFSSPDTRVRLMVRNRADAKNTAALAPLLDGGAETVEGDLTQRDSLDRATQNVDVIVSAVQGGPEVIVDGQVALAEAGKRNGVRRILPSDYALDLFKARPGEHAAFDLRRTADERIAKLGLDQINVLQGAFMWVFLPGHGAVDLEAGTISFFGDGDQAIETTSVEDTARVIARVATDPSVEPGKFAIAGDRLSFREAGEIVSKVTGRRLKPVSLGSEDDLRTAMKVAEPDKRIMLAYQLYMLNAQTALTDLQNERYPDVQLERFADFAAHELASQA